MKRREGGAKVWLVERAVPHKATMWRWEVDLGEGVFFHKSDALLAATETIGRYRVSRFLLTRIVATPKQPKPTVTRKVKRHG